MTHQELTRIRGCSREIGGESARFETMPPAIGRASSFAGGWAGRSRWLCSTISARGMAFSFEGLQLGIGRGRVTLAVRRRGPRSRDRQERGDRPRLCRSQRAVRAWWSARRSRRRPDPSDQRSAAELEEGQEETRRGNAIDWPKTIWISCRNPAKVSPNASVRPVMTMMITEVTLPTGPCIAANCSD